MRYVEEGQSCGVGKDSGFALECPLQARAGPLAHQLGSCAGLRGCENFRSGRLAGGRSPGAASEGCSPFCVCSHNCCPVLHDAINCFSPSNHHNVLFKAMGSSNYELRPLKE